MTLKKKKSKRRVPRRSRSAAARTKAAAKPLAAAPVTAGELRALRRELERRMRTLPSTRSRRTGKSAPLRWNPKPEDVQKSVAQLVLTIVEFLRQMMERQAIRRMEQRTLTPEQVEDIGQALMRLEETVRAIGKRFGLSSEDLNLDLGPIKLV